jgi:coenzyme PQQ synthesis protein D (PqqD)
MVDRDTLLSARMRLPEHVVHRTFVAETVILNLQTGKYHGLNPMGGHMLDVLGESSDVRSAAERVATEYDQDPDVVEDDFVAFCNDLLDRGLIELADGGSGTS